MISLRQVKAKKISGRLLESLKNASSKVRCRLYNAKIKIC